MRLAVAWGVVFGALNLAAPIAFWWLDPATVYGLAIPLIAAVYIGFAVADGRPKVLVVEVCVASIFVILGAAGITETAWILVIAYAGHGLKDFWQHRTHFVANTRWWPPFCANDRLPGRRRSDHRDRGRCEFPVERTSCAGSAA